MQFYLESVLLETLTLMQTRAIITCFISDIMLLQLEVNSCHLTERTTPEIKALHTADLVLLAKLALDIITMVCAYRG